MHCKLPQHLSIAASNHSSIRKALPPNAVSPVIAVKFINKDHAFKIGNLKPRQLQNEIALHSHLRRHKNIIEYYASGEDVNWRWIAMELADGGDLFDKIEADVGVGEDIAHLYFTQMVNAVSYMHTKGVAHRDLKPENVLVSGDGNLKIADFGLATLFRHNGIDRTCSSVVGSPPYIAPEIVTSGKTGVGYAPGISDVWSCGIVLFVLLVGNTPWDQPTMNSYEYKEYVDFNGRANPEDEMWGTIPSGALSLLHGMLKLEPQARFSLNEIRMHPWFTRPNRHLSASGTAADPLNLATQLMESLRIDFNAPTLSQRRHNADPDGMDVDSKADPIQNISLSSLKISSSQPETPMAESPFNWERPPAAHEGISASQPSAATSALYMQREYGNAHVSTQLQDSLANDVSMSQFTATPSVPISLTQAAKRFGDIVPSHNLTRFLSPLPLTLLAQLLNDAMHRLGVPTNPVLTDEKAYIQFSTLDSRGQSLKGTVIMERWNQEAFEVRFVKSKGDPLEWRRLFKKICVHCKDAILCPG
jgi:serine/threonine-protein kinase CHEK1